MLSSLSMVTTQKSGGLNSKRILKLQMLTLIWTLKSFLGTTFTLLLQLVFQLANSLTFWTFLVLQTMLLTICWCPLQSTPLLLFRLRLSPASGTPTKWTELFGHSPSWLPAVLCSATLTCWTVLVSQLLPPLGMKLLLPPRLSVLPMVHRLLLGHWTFLLTKDRLHSHTTAGTLVVDT